MKLKNIKINNLFGMYDYYLQFAEGSRYMILTSPNGYGKTTILNIINSLAKADLYYFYWLSFRSISLSFVEGAELIVESVDVLPEIENEKEKPDVPSASDREVSFLWIDSKGSKSRFVINERFISKAIRSIGYYEGRRLTGIFPYTKEFREFVRNNPKMLDMMAREQNSNAFFLQIKSIETVFIEAQRVFVAPIVSEQRNIAFRSDRVSTLPNYTIDEVAEKIKKTLMHARIKYLEYAQDKSNQLIYRLLGNKYKKLSNEEYNDLRTELLVKTQDMKHYGLIDEADIPEYDSAHAKELSAHIAETQDKLSKLDEIYGKVKLYSNLLERKEFAAKTISFSREKGLRVVASDQKLLELSELSSGEQNIVIMLYYLVFEYNRNKLLLVDEPEISLHVAWQYQYIDELEEILNINEGQAIIASHSPQIIGERWNVCCDLTEQGGHE